jgi:hypothetical protein
MKCLLQWTRPTGPAQGTKQLDPEALNLGGTARLAGVAVHE